MARRTMDAKSDFAVDDVKKTFENNYDCINTIGTVFK